MRLQLLCLEPDGMWDEGDCDALEELCKATFPRCAMQWCDDDEELWSDDAAADSDIEGDGDGP